MTVRASIIILALSMAAGLAHTASARADAGWTPDAVAARAVYWSDRYGVSEDWMLGVFACESHFDAYQVGARGEIGAGQWEPATWRAYATGDIFDVDTNIRETVRAHADGLAGQWTCG